VIENQRNYSNLYAICARSPALTISLSDRDFAVMCESGDYSKKWITAR